MAAAAGVVSAIGPTPVGHAEGTAEITWRLTSSFPKSRDLLFGAAEAFAARVGVLSAGRFRISVAAPGEIAPGLQAIDAVESGKADLCHTSANYFTAKDPAFCFAAGLPFGPNARQQSAWFREGGGAELYDRFLQGRNLKAIDCGSTGARMGGWFRKEIRDVADLKGLKLRIGGLGALILSRLGVVPVATPGADVYRALETGTLDGADWLSPYDDEKLGLNRVAPFYHYPGWWEGGAHLSLFVDRTKWNALDAGMKAVLEAAAAETGAAMLARYDALNPPALIRLIRAGTQFRPFPHEVMRASYKQAQEVHREIAAANETFRAMYDSLIAFRADEYLWWQVAEYSYDTFMIRARSEG